MTAADTVVHSESSAATLPGAADVDPHHAAAGRLPEVAADRLHDAAVVRLQDVGSTNDEARERLADRAAVWVTAERQLAGRGRRGRAWVSDAGNLYASLAYRMPVLPLAPSAFGALPLAVAVAVADAVATFGVAPQLKWPNDVLVGGAKVCGLLLDADHRAGAGHVVIGCGINVAHHPSTLHATHLAAHAPHATADAVFDRLRPAMAARLTELDAADGVGVIRAAWLERAAGLGAPITVRLPRETVDGVFDGLDEAGRLILRQPAGSRVIAAGEVFFQGAPVEAAATDKRDDA